MGAIKINPGPARQFLGVLYSPFFSQAQGLAYLEGRGKRYQALCRFIFLQSLIGPHFEPGLSLRLDAALQDLEALGGRRRGAEMETQRRRGRWWRFGGEGEMCYDSSP